MERRNLLLKRNCLRTLVAAARTRECPENPPETRFEATTNLPVLPWFITGQRRTPIHARADLQNRIAQRARNPA